jgi:hypothetical protein
MRYVEAAVHQNSHITSVNHNRYDEESNVRCATVNKQIQLQYIQSEDLVLPTEIQKSVQSNIDGDPRIYILLILPIGDAEFAVDRLDNLLQTQL